LLVELDKRNAVTVRMAVPTLDAALARRIDSRSAPPAELLAAVAALAAERIATIVLVAPVVAGVNDAEPGVRRLMEAAVGAEACDVEAFAEGMVRKERERFRVDFDRLRLVHGFPRCTAGRG
jgi:DNA repair photolyase